MHKRRTRKQQIAIRLLTYGVMALVAILGVLFCLTWAMGFRIDWNDGKLTQVALLQLNSFPTGATVNINDEELPSDTPTRSNVKTGKTTVAMSKDGYRSWRKTVNILPSSVVWLNYVRLIPNSITTDTTEEFTDLTEIRESPDKQWLLLRHSDNSRSMTLADISSPKNVRFSELTIPSDKITWPIEDQNEQFSIVEWDKGSRFVLIKHTVGETVEYLELDRTNAGVVKNLTRDFGMSIASPHFSGTSGNVFFGITGTNIRKFDYGNNTASAPLVNHVQSYYLYGNNQLVYIASEEKDGQIVRRVGIFDDGRVTTVKTYAMDVVPSAVLLARFNNIDYLVVAQGEKVAIYPRPLERDIKSQPLYLYSPGGVDWLNLSPNGQFVLAGRAGKLVSLDLDTMLNYAFEVDGLTSAPQWLDNSHIVSTSNNHVTFMEFDGQNRENIVSARGRVGLSRDGEYLFSIGETSSGGAALQRSQLVID